LDLYPFEGNHLALLVKREHYDPRILSIMTDVLDRAYEYYAEATGREPTPYFQYNGKATIAAVPSSCGAGCGFLGATGIELQDSTFALLFNGVKERGEFDQTVFYELGRNYWFFSDQLEYVDPDVIGSVTTGFAVFMRFMAMEATDV